ncbi:MAG TPA: CDGSH iron-sulfur domain-containing protein [Acidimicrobiia bacterium]|nr:CDGSH iron-sulfur domain-containing protein [Acidimicrobiia bacterium]
MIATPPPEISITEDGPYVVSADLPIVPKRIVRTERGEAVAWATDPELPHETPVRLCRCGHSNDKPYCDNSHERVGFDGTETAPNEPFFERSKSYEGTGITVHRVGNLCAHTSFCANQITDWYQLLPDTGDTNARAEVVAMVEHCPSGALVLEIDGEVVEPDLPLAISPVEDGPYWVTGGVTITRSDGTPLEVRNRVALCRCGQSSNKPFCDGTHLEVGLEAKNPIPAGQTTAANVEAARRHVYGRIVLGVHDESSDETHSVAGMVARAIEADVLLLHAGDPGAEADRIVESAELATQAAGVPGERIGSMVRSDRPDRALHDAAREIDAGLIVVGRGGDHLARLPARVSHRSPCDVLVVARRGPDRPDAYQTVLIATDGTKTADRAARRGYDVAAALGAEVELVFVGHPATGDLIVSDTISMADSDVPTRTRLLRGKPAHEILAAADSAEADLIVVGNKGMTGLRMRAGTSVPGEVLKGARCDVLLCRTVHQRESELEPGDGGVIMRDGEPVAAYMDDRGELHVMSAKCTHLGCTVTWNPVDQTFDCPCHGSHFGPTGEVLAGPATEPLRRI